VVIAPSGTAIARLDNTSEIRIVNVNFRWFIFVTPAEKISVVFDCK